MSFISNASNFTLGDGVYNNVHGDIVYNFYGKIRRREEGVFHSAVNPRLAHSTTLDESDMPLLAHRAHKRRRLEDEDGIMVSEHTRQMAWTLWIICQQIIPASQPEWKAS
jgi:hypothetical protein